MAPQQATIATGSALASAATPTPTSTQISAAMASYLAENRSDQIIGTAVAFLILLTITVSLRFVARRLHTGPWIWADVYIPVAWLLNVGLIAISLFAVKFGAGKHAAAVPPQDIIPYLKTVSYAVPTFYIVVVNLPKLAIVDLYLHIFIDVWSRTIARIIQVAIVLNILINLPIVLTECLPIEALWTPGLPGGWCRNIADHFLWLSLPNIITDLVILLLPLPLIRKLQASKSTKVGLAFTFLVGSFGLITSIVRFVVFEKPVISWVDNFWAGTDALIWTMIEPSVYLMCACFITYRPLIKWINSRRRRGSHGSGTSLFFGSNNSNSAGSRGSRFYSRRRSDNMHRENAAIAAAWKRQDAGCGDVSPVGGSADDVRRSDDCALASPTMLTPVVTAAERTEKTCVVAIEEV